MFLRLLYFIFFVTGFNVHAQNNRSQEYLPKEYNAITSFSFVQFAKKEFLSEKGRESAGSMGQKFVGKYSREKFNDEGTKELTSFLNEIKGTAIAPDPNGSCIDMVLGWLGEVFEESYHAKLQEKVTPTYKIIVDPKVLYDEVQSFLNEFPNATRSDLPKQLKEVFFRLEDLALFYATGRSEHISCNELFVEEAHVYTIFEKEYSYREFRCSVRNFKSHLSVRNESTYVKSASGFFGGLFNQQNEFKLSLQRIKIEFDAEYGVEYFTHTSKLNPIRVDPPLSFNVTSSCISEEKAKDSMRQGFDDYLDFVNGDIQEPVSRLYLGY